MVFELFHHGVGARTAKPGDLVAKVQLIHTDVRKMLANNG
jgi:hypothetical protein